ncbi:MAG: hypothetical protein CVV45_09440, partial [Spirochaetae bacterium HGW-Spirochaetae-10]
MVTEVIAFSLLVIAILYFYYMDFRHRLNRLTARRDLVRAAERLGLKRKDSAEPGALGTFEGRVDGYFVRVTADQHTKISIKLKSKRDVWLFRTNRLEKWISRGAEFEPFPEAVSFSFRSRAL